MIMNYKLNYFNDIVYICMLKHRQTLVYVISNDHHSLNFFSPFVYTFSYSKQEIQRKS